MVDGGVETDSQETVESRQGHGGGEEVDDQWEATELRSYHPPLASRPEDLSPSISEHGSQTGTGDSSRRRHNGFVDRIKTFWRRHVVLTVSHEACRDLFGMFRDVVELIAIFHENELSALAASGRNVVDLFQPASHDRTLTISTALERTYLAYMRTSLAFAILGTTTAQLFRLQSSDTPLDVNLGTFKLGIPLAGACHGTALLYALLGACHFWRQQTAIARGQVWAGGFELRIIGFWSMLVCCPIRQESEIVYSLCIYRSSSLPLFLCLRSDRTKDTRSLLPLRSPQGSHRRKWF